MAQQNNLKKGIMNINTYIRPSIEVIEVQLENAVLSMSGDSIGIGGWKEDDDDFGGSAD